MIPNTQPLAPCLTLLPKPGPQAPVLPPLTQAPPLSPSNPPPPLDILTKDQDAN